MNTSLFDSIFGPGPFSDAGRKQAFDAGVEKGFRQAKDAIVLALHRAGKTEAAEHVECVKLRRKR